MFLIRLRPACCSTALNMTGSNLCRFSSISATNTEIQKPDKFRVLDLKKKKNQGMERRKARKPLVLPPRSESMPVDQDWVSMWPGPRSFHPASVPLPVRQGYPAKEGDAPLPKFGNAELMKIPNFLHLTPPAIERHCQAIKKFCTPWPSALKTDGDCQRWFPIEISTSDYCHSSPSIRDFLSRIVTLKVHLSGLEFDYHAKDKFLRLVAERYDPDADTVSLLTDRCPTKKQNNEYAHFLLTALYHESWRVEDWENDKSAEDMEFYDWQKSASRTSIDEITSRKPNLDQEVVPIYAKVVTDLIDEGEDEALLLKYKEQTKKMLLSNVA